jgi:SAM-dependent methyltransferase
MAIGMRRLLALDARTDAAELLESGRLSHRDVEANLADLARMNRLPGGTAASIHAISRLVGRGNGARIVDVGTGAGDMPTAFTRRGWHVIAVDVNRQVLDVVGPRLAVAPGIEVMEGDALALPLDDGSVDVAHGSLLLHHFEPEAAITALREMRRVARRGVIVNDLRRGRLPLAVTWMTVMALARSHVTRYDAIVSARRAYTVPELDELLAAAGLRLRWRSPPWLPRVATAATP